MHYHEAIFDFKNSDHAINDLAMFLHYIHWNMLQT